MAERGVDEGANGGREREGRAVVDGVPPTRHHAPPLGADGNGVLDEEQVEDEQEERGAHEGRDDPDGHLGRGCVRVRLDAQEAWRVGEHRTRVRPGESLAADDVEKLLGVPARHVGVALGGAGAGTIVENVYVPAGGDTPDREVNRKFGQKLDFIDRMTRWSEACGCPTITAA